MPLYARIWTDILDDPKLRLAADEGAKHLILLPWLIAWAKRADADGRIEISGKSAKPRQIAQSIPNTNARSVAKSLEELATAGVLTKDADGCYRFAAWDYRNSGKTSDSREAVAERVRKHRDRKRSASNADVTPGNALQRVTDVTDVTSKRVESREEREESREKRYKAGSTEKDSTASRPHRRRRPELPAAAREFGKHFYGSASLERQEDIRAQLVATLNGGASLRKGVRVSAHSAEQLERRCREVIAEGVNDPDRAIVVLLTKLADVGNASDSPTEKAAAATELDTKLAEGEGANRLALALAWLEHNPDVATEIDRLVDAGLTPGTMPAIRAIYRNAAITKAWRDAGEPVLETTAKTPEDQ